MQAQARVALLDCRGLVIRESTLRAVFKQHYDDLIRGLRVRHVPDQGAPVIMAAYKYVGEYPNRLVLLPRTMAPVLAGLGIQVIAGWRRDVCDQRRPGLELSGRLYPNQELLVSHLLAGPLSPERRAAGTATTILNLRAGMGKTYVAAGLAAALGTRMVYITITRPLRAQAVKDFRVLFPRATINAKDSAQDDITVLVIDTAVKKTISFYDTYGFTVFDEEHSLCTHGRSRIFHLAMTQVTFGMSATTENRLDPFDAIAHRVLGPVIRAESIPGFSYDDVKYNCTVNLLCYRGPPSHTGILTTRGRLDARLMRNQFMADQYRMRLAALAVQKLYAWRGSDGQRHRIFVFCEDLAPLRQLGKMLTGVEVNMAPEDADPVAPGDDTDQVDEAGGDLADDTYGIDDINVNPEDCFTDVSGDDQGDTALAESTLQAADPLDVEPQPILGQPMPADQALPLVEVRNFVGGIKDAEIQDIRDTARVFLSTYKYAGTGVSIQDATAMVLLSSRRNGMRQVLARILRRGSDLAIPRVVYDIVDQATPMRFQLNTRMQDYEYYEFAVKRIRVSWADVDKGTCVL